MLLVHSLHGWQFGHNKLVQPQRFQCFLHCLGIKSIRKDAVLVFECFLTTRRCRWGVIQIGSGGIFVLMMAMIVMLVFMFMFMLMMVLLPLVMIMMRVVIFTVLLLFLLFVSLVLVFVPMMMKMMTIVCGRRGKFDNDELALGFFSKQASQ